MRTAEDLERAYRALGPEPRGAGTVRLICARRGGGAHETPGLVELSREGGLHGDRWARDPDRKPDRQLTLMSARVAALVTEGHTPLDGPGDNLLVDLEMSAEALPAGTRLAVGSAIVEVTEAPHTGCKKFSARFGVEALLWVNGAPNRARRLRGIHAQVVSDGWVKVGDAVRVLPAG